MLFLVLMQSKATHTGCMLFLFTDNLKSNRRGDDEDEEEMDDEKDLRLMGVDEAIIYSIEKCGMQCSILCHLFS